MEPTLSQEALKQLVKTALLEVFEENRPLFVGLMQEALEDLALGRAIEEGLQQETVSREAVFKTLRQKD
jgi:hypothetical protein